MKKRTLLRSAIMEGFYATETGESIFDTIEERVLALLGEAKTKVCECGEPNRNYSGICDECCSHEEHDHGICSDCEKDITGDLAGRAEALYEGDR